MTIDEIKEIGLPIENLSLTDVLIVESAFEWILRNTSLGFEITNIEELKSLPSCVKLFVIKFHDVMTMQTGVASESIEGLSQSFSTGQNDVLIEQFANELLGDYMKSGAVFFMAQNRWGDD
jgi:hypothetical protein